MGSYNPYIALSYSRMSDYLQCPLKFKSKYIDKDYPDDSDNPAFVKGNAIHKQVENYIIWLGSTEKGSPPEMGQYTKDFTSLLHTLHSQSGGKLYPEKQLATNQSWEHTTWFAKPDVVKWRAIIDFMAFMSPNHLLLGDVKSGKVQPYQDGPLTQLRLSASMCFSLYPKIETITSAYFFVEHKVTDKAVFHRESLPEMVRDFDAIHEKINTDKEFAYQKNQYCKWCLVPAGKCPIRKAYG